MKKKIEAFEVGHWYRYTVRKGPTWGWHDRMQEVCDGKPNLCIYGEGKYAEFKDRPHYDFGNNITDEDIITGRRVTRGWYWAEGFEYWEEVNTPKDVSRALKSITAHIEGMEDYCAKDVLASSLLASTLTSATVADTLSLFHIEPEYSFKLPKRSDLRAALLRRLSI